MDRRVVRAVADVVDAKVLVVPVAAVEEAVVGDVGGEDAVAAGHRLAEGGDVVRVHFAVAVEVGVVAALGGCVADCAADDLREGGEVVGGFVLVVVEVEVKA